MNKQDAPEVLNWPAEDAFAFGTQQLIVWEGQELGVLYNFNPPGRHIFKASHTKLRALEDRAWLNECHACIAIHAWARAHGLVPKGVHSQYLDPP